MSETQYFGSFSLAKRNEAKVVLLCYCYYYNSGSYNYSAVGYHFVLVESLISRLLLILGFDQLHGW